MFAKLKDKAKRVLAGVLALTMMIPGYVPSLAATDSLEETANPALPTISVEWGAGQYLSEDGVSTNIVEYDPTNNNVKLKVSYFQKEVVETGYAAGELVITVKGIGALNRPGTMEAIVGADKAGTEVKTRDWTYTWNKATDTYTFVNNEPIEAGSVFSGYFEMLWPFYSRDDITDYAQADVQAVMYIPTGEYVESNILTFSNKTFCDVFDNEIEADETILYNVGLDGLVDGNPNDYIWVNYSLDSYRIAERSRGLCEGADDYFNPDSTGVGSGAVIVRKLSSDGIVANTANSLESSTSYKVGTSHPTGSGFYSVWVAYPRSEYDGKTVIATLNTYGAFHEYDDNKVEGTVLLASDSCEVLLEGYLREPVAGGGIDVTKGPETSYVTGASSAEPFEFGHTISADSDLDGSVDIEIADDALYIMQADGVYRKLTASEYWMDYITVSAPSSFVNANGWSENYPSDYVFPYDVYVALDGNALTISEENLVTSGTLTPGARQTVNLPEGTTSVSVVYRDVDHATRRSIYVHQVVQPDDSKNTDGAPINYNGGNVVNTAFVRYYDESGNRLKADVSRYNLRFASKYASDAISFVMADDIERYGYAMLRHSAIVYLRQPSPSRGNRVISDTVVTDPVANKGKYTSMLYLRASFSSNSGEYPSQFTIYTVIPDYASPFGCKDSNDLWSAMTLSGENDFAFESDYLKNHCTVEMVEDYKGTGATFVALHFDFSDADIFSDTVSGGSIQAVIPLRVDSIYYEGSDGVIHVKSAVDVESFSDDCTYYDIKTVDDGEWYKDYPVADIDGDGDTSERLAYSSDSETWLYVASSQWQQVKKVKTSRTDDEYVITSEEDTREDYPEAEYGTEYSYMMSVTTGNSLLKDAVIYDYLEQGEQAEWQGTFKNVDLRYVKKMGIEPVVYYSTNPNASQDLTSADWTTEPADMSAVKAIAIDLRAYEIPEKTTVRVIINMIAPDDPALKNKITENEYFSVGTMVDLSTGIETVIGDDLPSNLVQVRLVPPYRRLTITKTDATDGAKLPDALFALYIKNADGTMGELFATGKTNGEGVLTFKDVPEDMEYILVETDAPAGYAVAGEQTITFNNANVSITVANDRHPGTVELIKVSDLSSNVLVAGAEYTIYDADGNVVDTQVTNAYGKLTFTGLVWGNYTVKETASPAGYELNETVYEVSITKENCETVQTISTVDMQSAVSVRLNKYAADTQGNETEIALSGAVFELLRKVSDDAYKSIGTYVTDKNGHIDLSELIYGDYILREIRAPQSYEMCEELFFTLSPENREVVLTAYDVRKPGSIVISKNDDMGSMVEGAEFTLYAEDKTTVVATVTTNEAGVAMFDGLEWGTYYVKETVAPQGYVLDETFYYVNISASKLNVTLTVTNETMKGSVLLTKTDEAGVYKLSGAEFSLYTTTGTLLAEGLTTDENGQILVEDLPWGSYYFEETKAPVGYGLNTEKIRFSVNYKNCEITQELEVTDPQENRVITLTKRIKADEINFDNGKPSFTFKLEGTDVNGNAHAYYRVVTFTEDYVEANTDENGYVSIRVTISGFLAGTYTASEEESARYYLAEISEYDGTKNGNTVVFDMVNNDYGKATFTNRRYEGQNFSDTGTVTNVLNERAKLTGITANWTADTLVEANTDIDRNNLVVTAYYDDGTFEVLENDEYELNVNTFPNRNGNYTVKVSYTFGDVTKSDSFDVEIYGMKLSIVALTAEPAVDYVVAGQPITPDMIKVTAHFNDGSTQEVLSSGFQHADPVVLHTHDLTYADSIERTVQFNNASSLTLDIFATSFSNSYNRFGYSYYDFDGNYDGESYTYSNSGSTLTHELDGNAVTVYAGYASSTYNAVIDVTFTITPHYDAEETPAAYIMDKTTAPTVGNAVDIIVKLNPDMYTDATELALETTVSLNVKPDDAHMVTDASFKKGLTSYFSSATSVVFTDEAIPADATVYDVSDNFEESVFMWMDSSNTVHVSSGVEGKKIIAGESLNQMFYQMTKLTSIDFSNLYVTDATTSMEYMFGGCSKLTSVTGANHWDTSNVTNMGYLFQGCSGLTDISGIAGWDTGNVTDMSCLFQNCTKLSDISALANWDTGCVTDMGQMFSGCKALTNVDALADWETGAVTDMSAVFSNCSNLTSLVGLTDWDVSSVTTMKNMFYYCSNLTNTTGLNAWKTDSLTNMESMFYYCSKLTDVAGMSGWDTSDVTTMKNMFLYCTKLNDTTGMLTWDTGSVTDMESMFERCTSLTNVDGLVNWNVSNVKTMTSMFEYCSKLSDISGLANWKPGSVTDMHAMFKGCSSLTDVDALSEWTVGSVEDIGYMFDGCSMLSDISGLAKWTTDSVTDMSGLFKGCSSLTDTSALSNWNTGNVEDMSYMFEDCSSLTNLAGLSNWNLGSVTASMYLFHGCSSLTSAALADIAGWDVTNIQRGYGMFSGCSSLTNVDALADWDFAGAVGTGLSGMFADCSKLTDISALANWDVSHITDFGSMFSGCSSLTSVDDLATWNTGSATSMSSMFYNCSSLSDISTLANWDVSKVTSLAGMFSNCTSLTNVDAISNWDTSSVTQLQRMFNGCTGLTKVYALANWDVSKVTRMSEMFYGCTNLTVLDLWGWTVTSLSASYSDMYDMFAYCSYLTTIYGQDWIAQNANVASSNHTTVFRGCDSLGSDTSGAMCTPNGGYFSTPNTVSLTIDNQCPDILSITLPDTVYAGSKVSVTPVDGIILYSFEVDGVETIGTAFSAPRADGTVTISNANYWTIDAPNSVTYELPSIGTPGATQIQLTPATENLVITSFDVNGQTVSGDTLTLPATFGTVTIDNVKFLQQIVIESPHNPYLNSQNYVSYGSAQFEGATSLTVELTYQTHSTSYDWVYLYDADGNIINNKKYGGSTLTTETITVEGNFVEFVMKTNASGNNYYGFKAVVTPNYPADPIELTVDNQSSDILDVIIPGVVISGITQVPVTAVDGYVLYSFEVDGVETIGSTFTAPEESGTVTISNPKYWTIDAPDTVVVVQPETDTVEPGVTEIQLVPTGENKVIVGFEVNGTTVTGDSFVIPEEIGTVIISNVTFIDQIIIESEHNPYPNNMNTTTDGIQGKVYGEATCDGATSLTVELTYQTEGTNWDWIYLYDADGNIVNNTKYGGTTQKTETITVTGDYVKIVFRTDGSGNSYYGFKAVITPNYD